MGECESWEYCVKCGKTTSFIFSGSGTKGMCLGCGYCLPPEQKATRIYTDERWL